MSVIHTDKDGCVQCKRLRETGGLLSPELEKQVLSLQETCKTDYVELVLKLRHVDGRIRYRWMVMIDGYAYGSAETPTEAIKNTAAPKRHVPLDE